MANPRVLLVDSDPSSLGLLTHGMSRFGLQTQSATNLETALAALRGQRPDVVVSEIDGGAGLRVLEQLRLNPSTRDVPMLLMAKGAWARRRQQARDLGAQELVAKPAFVQDIAVLTWLYAGKSAGEDWFEGSFGTPSLPVLLRGLLAGGRSGTLRLEPTGAVVRFRDGAVVDASFDPLAGERALLRILTLSAGSYELTFGPLASPATLQFELADLAGRGLGHVRQWAEVSAKIAPLDRVLAVDFEALSAQLPDLPHGLWALLRLFDGKRTLSEVLADSALDELTTGRAIAKLMALELFEPPVRESWEGVTPALPPRLAVEAPRLASAQSERQARPTTQAAVATTSLQLPVPPERLPPIPLAAVDDLDALPDFAVDLTPVPLRLSADVAVIDDLERDFFDAPVDAREWVDPAGVQPGRESAIQPLRLLGWLVAALALAGALALLWRGTPGAEIAGDPAPTIAPPSEAAATPTVAPGAVPARAAAPEGSSAPAIAAPASPSAAPTAAPLGLAPSAVRDRSVPDEAAAEAAAAAAPVPAAAAQPDSPAGAPNSVPAGVPAASAAGDLIAKGQSAYDRHQLKQAVAAFSQARALAPDDPVSALGLGLALYDSGKLGPASEALERAVALDPKSARAEMLLGAIAQEKNQMPAARQHYARALELDPNGEHAQELKDLLPTLGK